MKWRNAVASIALVSALATEAFAAEKFACAEYFQATRAGQKKAEAGRPKSMTAWGTSTL